MDGAGERAYKGVVAKRGLTWVDRIDRILPHPSLTPLEEGTALKVIDGGL